MTRSPPDQPAVRALEVIPLDEGRFLVQDPSGLMEAPLELSSLALLLLACCDGQQTRAQIQATFQERTGRTLGAEELDGFLRGLDEAGALDSPRLRARQEAMEQEFRRARWRAAVHAGVAYEGEPDLLGRQLDGWLAEGANPVRTPGPLRALVAPHIDLQRGGRGYGITYATLRRCQAPEVVVLLGTAHAPTEGRFVLCDKGFETPRGALPPDGPFLARLRRRLGGRYEAGMRVHAREHSLEFQALFLAHLYPASPPAIVPVLCGSMEECVVEGGRSPEELPEVADFLGALQETWAEETRPCLVVAGADLSHVGPRFGDERPVDPEFLQEVRGRDLAALGGAAADGADGFLRAVAEHGNRHRICSVAALYSTLATVRASTADLLHYDQAVDDAGHLAVSYAGMALYGDSAGPGLRWHDPQECPTPP